MDQFAARIDGVLHHLEDQGVGGRQMLKIARASPTVDVASEAMQVSAAPRAAAPHCVPL